MPKNVEVTTNNPAGVSFFSPKFEKFWRIHERVMQPLTGENGFDFGTIQKDKLNQTDIGGVMAAMHVESHNPVYTEELQRKFRHDFEMAAFIGTWSYEEMKHFYVLHEYALESGLVDPNELAAELEITRAGPWGEDVRRYTEPQIYTYTMIQEQGTGRLYYLSAKQTEEPLLKRVYNYLSGDEYRHCEFYLYKGKQAIEKNPGVVPEMVEAAIQFEFPGPGFVYKYPEKKQALNEAAKPSIKDVASVVGRVGELFGTQRMIEIALDPANRRAFEEKYHVDIIQILRESAGQAIKDALRSRLPFFSFPGSYPAGSTK